jgi:hypothetical protein
MPGGGMRMGPNMPGMMQQTDPTKMMGQMQQQMQQQMQARGLVQGQAGPGGAGPGGTSKVDEGPADVRTAVGAVRTFLNALKAKDADRLSEATARRAALESSGKNQDLFSKILEVSLSDSELDDLAKKFDGYQLAFENPQKSTAKIEVVVQKPGDSGNYFRRKITVRREKKGWGVLDIGPEQNFKGMGAVRRPANRN